MDFLNHTGTVIIPKHEQEVLGGVQEEKILPGRLKQSDNVQGGSGRDTHFEVGVEPGYGLHTVECSYRASSVNMTSARKLKMTSEGKGR